MNNIIVDNNEIEIKERGLTKIKVDGENWFIYYIDKITGEKWLKEYPHSSYLGGGSPQLRRIKKFDWE